MRSNVCAPKKSRCACVRFAGRRSQRYVSKYASDAENAGTATPVATHRATRRRHDGCERHSKRHGRKRRWQDADSDSPTALTHLTRVHLSGELAVHKQRRQVWVTLVRLGDAARTAARTA
jgi:hypothetical protein